MDLFDNTILCKDCGKKMQLVHIEKDGFKMRALKCPSCSNHIIHPADIEEYNKFKQLRHRQFHVKLRMVGNSYTVSIPREIVNFIQDTESEMISERRKVHERMSKQMQEMVTLAMEEFGKLSLMFNEVEGNDLKEEKLIKKDARKILKEGQ